MMEDTDHVGYFPPSLDDQRQKYRAERIRNLNFIAAAEGGEPFDPHNENITQANDRLGWLRLWHLGAPVPEEIRQKYGF